MTFSPAAHRRLSTGAAAFALAGLSACAGVQKPPPVAPSAPTAPTPIVSMAPIANPERAAPARREPAAPTHARSAEGVAAHRAALSHPVPAVAPPPLPHPSLDPAAAARLRARGLEELNRGAVAKAVALLTQANRLDPSSTVIRRDLDRAERINRAVHAPH